MPLGSSVYVDELTVPSNLSGYQADISSFDIAHNILTGDFVEANGVGYGDTSTNLQLTDNEFSLNAGTTAVPMTAAISGSFSTASLTVSTPRRWADRLAERSSRRPHCHR